MRTTLTLDDDVAVQVERLRRERDANLKDIINQALRLGLDQMRAPPKPRKPFRTKPIRGVTPLLPSMDNIGEVLALIEGEDHR